MYKNLCLIVILSCVTQLTFAGRYLILNKDAIKEVAYTTSSAKGIGQAAFGHGFLRFRNKRTWITQKDVTVEFITPRKQAYQELEFRAFGTHKNSVEIRVRSFKETYKMHTYTQGRTLTNYTLKLTDVQRNYLIDAINMMIKNHVKYRFLKENHNSRMKNLLEETVGNKFAGFKGYFPLSREQRRVANTVKPGGVS